jgi:hypothetical protein
MTRRGSLVYYLTAWVVGCVSAVSMILFFPLRIHDATVFYSPSDLVGGSGVGSFLGFTMESLVVGALPALLFAWILRRIMAKFPAAGTLPWIFAGSVLSLALCSLLGVSKTSVLGYLTSGDSIPVVRLGILVLLGGPVMVYDTGLLSSVPAGAITAYVLFLVNRAFDPQKEFLPS